MNQIAFCEIKLDDWYEKVKDKRDTRVSVVHNNLSLDHYLKGREEALISWDSSIIDSPILDIYNFYKKEALDIEFSSILKEYLKNTEDEFRSCQSIGASLDYVFKTEYLVRPYYAIDDEEQ